MTAWRPWPRSLAGQMALLVALALFVAQAINLGLALRERAAFRVATTASLATTRIADALERQGGRGVGRDRGRVRLVADNPVLDAQPHRDDVAGEVRSQLTALGISVARVETAIRPATPRNRPGARASRRPRHLSELVIAVEQPGRGWLITTAPWPGRDPSLLWRLIGQTLILYAVMLLPVMWVARRISRPLATLAAAARGFKPGVAAEPLDEDGPYDVRVVIGAFNALRVRVDAMLDEKDRMLGAIGHDLRTPLAALRVRVESVEDDADRVRMVETIEDMNRTLDDILSLARLGRPSEPPTEVDMAALVDAVVEDFRDLGADVTLEDSDRVRMRLRPSLIRRAVRNLIENAIKYAGSAEVRIAPGSGHVAIVVADRGPGIPEDRQAAVFEAFTRLETSRNRDTGGIGLGLALARAIVREAGGDITLANRAGGGLEATITLPR